MKGKGQEPRKPEVMPRVALKKIFWNPICLDESDEAKSELNIWEKIHQQGASFDKGELEELFADAPATRVQRDSFSAPSQAHRPSLLRRSLSIGQDVDKEKRRLFTEKRRRQIWFMVPSLPDWNRIPEAILNLDGSVLTNENVDLLHLNLPTADEELMLLTAKPLSEDEIWDTAEDFIMMIIGIPDYTLRIQAWCYLNTFDETFLRLQEAKVNIAKACTALQGSVRIERLLAVILYVGNYLNGGTPRGRADGFDIDTLLKIGTLKSLRKDSDGTLLDFIVKQIEQESPGMLSAIFASGMEKEHVHRVKKTKMSDLIDEIWNLLGQADDYLGKWDGDSFPDNRKSELLGRAKQLRDLQDEFNVLNEEYARLCIWFQMDSRRLKPTDEFFGIWDTFLEEVARALNVLRSRQVAQTKQSPRRSTLMSENADESPTPGARTGTSCEKRCQTRSRPRRSSTPRGSRAQKIALPVRSMSDASEATIGQSSPTDISNGESTPTLGMQIATEVALEANESSLSSALGCVSNSQVQQNQVCHGEGGNATMVTCEGPASHILAVEQEHLVKAALDKTIDYPLECSN
jgi:hypothetical protein